MNFTRPLVASIVAVALASAAAPIGSQTQRRDWTKPGVFRFAELGDPNSLNPLLAQSTNDTDIDLLFDNGLVIVDDKGRIIPQLAARVPTVANGDISKDGKTIVYHLRKGVKWQDGVEFTSKDVRFSWQAIMNPANNVAGRSGFDTIERIDTPDPYTAVLRMKTPYAPMIASFFSGSSLPTGVIPEHLLAKYPNINQVDYNQKPIGTGPFRVVAWNHGRSVELEANPDYFLGKPKLSHISVKIVPNMTTIGVQLRTHEIDLADLDSATYRDVRDDPDLRIELGNQYVFVALVYNMSRPGIADRRVRQAIAHAIDRKGLMERLTFGTAELATGDIPSLSWAHTADVATYAYDPQKAAALLDEAGWKPGPDGIRVKNGARLAFDMVEIAGSTSGHGLDVNIQESLKTVGIDLQIKSYAPALVFGPAAEGGILAGGKFDLSVSSWVAPPDPDNSSFFMCKYFPPDGQNNSRYCNHAMDVDQDRAMANYDDAVRKPIYARIERTVLDDLPMYPLYYPKRRIAMNPDLTGVKFNGISLMWNAAEFSL